MFVDDCVEELAISPASGEVVTAEAWVALYHALWPEKKLLLGRHVIRLAIDLDVWNLWMPHKVNQQFRLDSCASLHIQDICCSANYAAEQRKVPESTIHLPTSKPVIVLHQRDQHHKGRKAKWHSAFVKGETLTTCNGHGTSRGNYCLDFEGKYTTQS